jgi:transcriptional regulator with XRE-family HTH domain
MEKIGTTLKAFRKKKGMTQQELADKVFVTKQAVSKWENDKGFPDISLIQPLSEILGVSVEQLLGARIETVKPKKIRPMVLGLLLFGIALLGFLILMEIIPYYQVQDYVKTIETSTGVDLPSGKEFEEFDFQDWTLYGNTISVAQMGYVVFEDDRSTIFFEEALITDEKWMSTLGEDLSGELPPEVLRYTQNGDYFLLYHPEGGEYGQLSSESGEERYFFLVYQTENHRLLFFDFTM